MMLTELISGGLQLSNTSGFHIYQTNMVEEHIQYFPEPDFPSKNSSICHDSNRPKTKKGYIQVTKPPSGCRS